MTGQGDSGLELVKFRAGATWCSNRPWVKPCAGGQSGVAAPDEHHFR